MIRRIVPALALSAALALSGTAVATTTADRTGSFEATGTGTIAMQGNLKVFSTRIDAAVTVRSSAPVMFKLNGKRVRPTILRIGAQTVRVFTLRRARGALFVEGKGLRITLRSPKTPLSVTTLGRGSVTQLRGAGLYRLNGEAEAQWSDVTPLLPLRIKPPPPAAARALAVGSPA